MDVLARTPGTHLQDNQIEELRNQIEQLQDQGVAMSQIIAISPFRVVANALGCLRGRYPGLRGGTIHTAQGREADAVFLVLGGDPGAPGAKAWASSTVNLVNVAASRAKRRLYVIGDRAAWAQYPYFADLASVLASEPLQAAGKATE
ncbi:AAA domain-containing protein [Actinomyces oris]|uniref:AAA domain-containing protein n=1 Tax=Actinomyces oris TaxID=544580 RepID=UPI00320883C9